VIGGLVVLALGAATGRLGERTTETVVVPSPRGALPSDQPAAVRSTALPLAGNRFDPARLYASRADGVVTIYALFGDGRSTTDAAQGSGFVVSADGYVLTNSHVITTAGEGDDGDAVKAADRVFVEFRDGEREAARVVGWDLFDDVGVLKLDPKAHPLSPVPLGDSAAVAVGEPVAAIGSPFGEQSSLAVGVVSATRRSISALTSKYVITDAIQTDAPINRGNSGGPLFDARGRVIGINAQINSTSGEAEGVGFAVPINSARRSMQQLIANGSVSYAYVGVETTDLTPALARRFGYAVQRGAVVTDIVAGSPAAKGGLHPGRQRASAFGLDFPRSGDVIVAIDDHHVTGSEDIARIVTSMSPGQVARFAIERGDTRLVLPLRLAERSESS
jgi:S1-C subfamily serine protease